MCADGSSTVPSSRPVASSTICTAGPPVPRRPVAARPFTAGPEPARVAAAQQPAVAPGRPRPRGAAGPNSSRSASVSGSSAAAAHRCGASTYGLSGSSTVASTGLCRRRASGDAPGRCRAGRRVRSARPRRRRPVRPARPACCHSEARVPGQPAISTASSPQMSTPSSSALVVARPLTAPVRSACSSARRSSGR